MPKRYLFFLAFITIFCGCRSAQHGNQHAGIYIWTPTGWWLDIKPDGSGQYGYGNSFPHSAFFASGTFKFNEIFNKLSATTFEGGNIREHCAVCLQKKADTKTVGNYTKDKDLIRELFELAHKNSGVRHLTQTNTVKVEVRPNDYLNKLWLEKPPIPD
jgi:hypothetical protein